MSMTPIPVRIALPLIRTLPIDILTVLLLPVHVVRPVLALIPFVIIVMFPVVNPPVVILRTHIRRK